MQDLKKYERVGNYIEFKKHFLKEKEKAKLKEQKAKR
jgi:bifunctional N-acetylglucosamine-1-phosphate-uridyltransferase/glucosamine-1-phosphate-acetyltransferase GlmU-like protein